MTAWTAMFIPTWILAKCGVDFIVLEYGSKFQFISDNNLSFLYIAICGFALFVDIVNFCKTIRDN